MMTCTLSDDSGTGQTWSHTPFPHQLADLHRIYSETKSHSSCNNWKKSALNNTGIWSFILCIHLTLVNKSCLQTGQRLLYASLTHPACNPFKSPVIKKCLSLLLTPPYSIKWIITWIISTVGLGFICISCSQQCMSIMYFKYCNS